MDTNVRNDWRELSQAASKETDPEKLLELVEQLNKVLEERENELRGRITQRPGARQAGPPSFAAA